MDLKEFMSVRRAYNIVRHMVDSRERLTFEEYAILCRLETAGEPLKTSDIAEYQGALRPTMTHRTNHLATLGYIERIEGAQDRRNVICAISEKGVQAAADLSEQVRLKIPSGRALSRTSSDRIKKYVDTMGSYFCKAGDLVLLGLFASKEGTLSIMQIVDALGLLQPTVSMSVSALVDEGLVTRARTTDGSHTTSVTLTPKGTERALVLAAQISELVVRRKPRV